MTIYAPKVKSLAKHYYANSYVGLKVLFDDLDLLQQTELYATAEIILEEVDKVPLIESDCPMLKVPEYNIYKPFRYPFAYEAWLTQQKIHWIPEEIPLGEDVRDWHNKLTAPERNLITQIFRLFTQCYDKKTEILTARGWVLFKDLTPDDKVAQVNEDTSISYVKPTNYHTSKYSGPMYHYCADTAHLDLLVTPNHKMVFKNKNKNYKGDKEAWQQAEACDFKPYQGIKIIKGAVHNKGKNNLTPMDRLRIAYQADGRHTLGNTGERNNGYIIHHFGFIKARKVKRLENIIQQANLKYTKRYKGRYTWFRVWVNERMDKDFSWLKFDKISTNWCKEFLNELYRWDGSKHTFPSSLKREKHTHYTYSNTNVKAVDQVQAIITMSGYGHGCSNGNESDISYKFNNCLRASWCKDILPELDGHAIKRNSSVKHYNGKVYCVTVPSGKIIVRRNRKVAVCGNSDIEVRGAYSTHYKQILQPTEVLMMMTSFENMETIHIAAYAYLLDTIGMPEVEYSAFLKYQEMKEKYDYMKSFKVTDIKSLLITIAAFAAFTEGLQLFASFAMLMNFPRFNKLKGMGQIVTFSVRDESLHCQSMIQVFHEIANSHPECWNDAAKEEVYNVCHTIVEHEDAFIDLAFEMGDIEGLKAKDVKGYVRFIADRRLKQLGLKRKYGLRKNPLPWMDEVLGLSEHANFFEQRATEYSKAASDGTWDEAFSIHKNSKAT